MYLRQTKRANKDGSVVAYLQLAHNERHPVTGAPTAKVIHNFGRVDKLDRDALARLVSSISRFLSPSQASEAAAGAVGGEVQVLESRRLGGAWVLNALWERLGIGAAIRRVAAGRRLDAETVERVVFALVAQRALEPGSKLAATSWVAERVAIDGLGKTSTIRGEPHTTSSPRCWCRFCTARCPPSRAWTRAASTSWTDPAALLVLARAPGAVLRQAPHHRDERPGRRHPGRQLAWISDAIDGRRHDTAARATPGTWTPSTRQTGSGTKDTSGTA